MYVDGIVSLALTEDYRIRPYLVRTSGGWEVASIIIAESGNIHLRYILGAGLDLQTMWRGPAGPDGLRVMAAGWVLHFDCNPDLLLARPTKEQNEYLASRDMLGLPALRWAAPP